VLVGELKPAGAVLRRPLHLSSSQQVPNVPRSDGDAVGTENLENFAEKHL